MTHLGCVICDLALARPEHGRSDMHSDFTRLIDRKVGCLLFLLSIKTRD